MVATTLSLSSLTLLSLLSLAKATVTSFSDLPPANATGSFSFPGLPFANTTTPAKPWTLNYDVIQEGPDTKQKFELVVPSDNVYDNSTPWNTLCVRFLHTIFPNATDTVKDENGDCGKTLSKECSDALKVPSSTCERITPSNLPNACKSFFNRTDTSTFELSSNIYQNFTGLGHFWSPTSTAKNAGLKSMYYQEALKKITPVLVTEYGPGSAGEARLVCVRQTKVNGGSAPVITGSPTTASPLVTTTSTQMPKSTNDATVAEGWSGGTLLSIAIVAVGFSLF